MNLSSLSGRTAHDRQRVGSGLSQLSRLKTLIDVLRPACLLLSCDRHKHLSLCWAFVGTRSGCKKKTRSNARQTSVFQVTLRSVSVVSCWDPKEPGGRHVSSTLLSRQWKGSWRNCDVYWRPVNFSLSLWEQARQMISWISRFYLFLPTNLKSMMTKVKQWLFVSGRFYRKWMATFRTLVADFNHIWKSYPASPGSDNEL